MEDAKKFASIERFKDYSGGPELFLIFKVQVEEHLLPEPVKENETIFFNNVNPAQIGRLDKSIVDEQALFGNTLSDFTHGSGCSIL